MVNVDKIKALANEQGLKLGFVCSQLGLTESFFRNVKKGKTKITDDRLATIANILNTTPEYLRDETDQKEKPAEPNITPHERAVLLAYREKTDMQKAVDQLLDVKSETPLSPSQSAEDPQDARLDQIIKLVDARLANGALDPNNAKIAAVGGYENPVTGEKAEWITQVKQLVQDILEEQRKQENK